ncbi:MAG: TetR/AcrR family transcriptional regulator [Deltaproteobacteria bacterium]|nr:TetR/AcrR family transcriptional regulator [Deltaproteobacteria bacterium]
MDTRKRLLTAGTALFAEKGYSGTRVREIAELAEVSKPVLYYYFKNKEELFSAILNSATEIQTRIISKSLENRGHVQDRLLYLYDQLYQAAVEHQDLFKMVHNILFGTPKVALHQHHSLIIFQNQMVDTIKTIYGDGLLKKEVKDTQSDDIAILIVSLMRSCYFRYHLHSEVPEPHRFERMLRLIFKGVDRDTNNFDATYGNRVQLK